MKMNKYVLGGFAAILFSPVFFEIPVMWHWVQAITSKHFSTDNNISTFTEGIHVWGSANCNYTTSLIKSLNSSGINYTYHDIGTWQQSRITATEMWQTVRLANPRQQWSLPVVNANGTPVVGFGTNINDVAKVLDEQGQLPFQYVTMRAGIRIIFILLLEAPIILAIYSFKNSLKMARK